MVCLKGHQNKLKPQNSKFYRAGTAPPGFEIPGSPVCYYLPLKNGVVLYLKNLNSLYQRIICVKFGWN